MKYEIRLLKNCMAKRRRRSHQWLMSLNPVRKTWVHTAVIPNGVHSCDLRFTILLKLKSPLLSVFAAGSGLLAELAELKKENSKPKRKQRFQRLDFVVQGLYFLRMCEPSSLLRSIP